jgi:hypothetical protein
VDNVVQLKDTVSWDTVMHLFRAWTRSRSKPKRLRSVQPGVPGEHALGP